MTYIDRLNRRLGERLGLVCGGTAPRFAWKYAPEEPYYIYDRDDRTVIRKTWADVPSPSGGPLGKVWLLSEWRVNKTVDHFGYGDGIRVPVVRRAGYSPYFETALQPGELPSEALNQNYVWALDKQLQASSEHDPNAMANALAEESYIDQKTDAADSREWRESALAEYDNHVGAFGNCAPGTAGGYMSFGGV